jgi:hypothetical protein
MTVHGTIKGGMVILEQPVPVPDGTRVVVEVPEPQPERMGKRRKAGGGKGILTIVQDDDEHLKDFAEYM